MDDAKDHWITALALLAAAFLLFIGVAQLADANEEGVVMTRIGGAVGLFTGLALLAGLWGLRTGRLKLWVAHVLIIPGVIYTAAFFWLFIPLIVAVAVLYAGVIKRGLQRELRPS